MLPACRFDRGCTAGFYRVVSQDITDHFGFPRLSSPSRCRSSELGEDLFYGRSESGRVEEFGRFPGDTIGYDNTAANGHQECTGRWEYANFPGYPEPEAYRDGSQGATMRVHPNGFFDLTLQLVSRHAGLDNTIAQWWKNRRPPGRQSGDGDTLTLKACGALPVAPLFRRVGEQASNNRKTKLPPKVMLIV